MGSKLLFAEDASAALRSTARPVPGRADLLAVLEPDAKHFLRSLGVPVPLGGRAADAASLAGVAHALRPPLVVKAFGHGIVHKSDVGAVRLGAADVAAAVRAAEEISRALAGRGLAAEGFLVEEQAAAGVELIVGVLDRPPLGACVAIGAGGVLAEVLDDVRVRPWPLSRADALEMLDELRISPLLDGHRGAAGVDREALVAIVLAIGSEQGAPTRLGPHLAELELNPVIAGPAGAVAVDARLLLRADAAAPLSPACGPTDFTPLFEPRSIAVVGASAKRSGFGNLFLRNYRSFGFAGELVAVHPSAGEIEGVRAIASLADLPGGVDYALVAVPAEQAADVVRGARARFVQVMSGGFSEAGGAGRALEQELAAAARAGGSRLLGPNCMGVWCARGGQTFLGGAPRSSGGVSILSQSGGLAGDILKLGDRLGLRFARLASIGNCADVTAGELAGWLVRDPHTRVLGLYLEGPRDGAALVDALRRARGRTPVALLVGGLSAEGARAAASHTGALASDARAWEGLCAQTGAAQTHGFAEFLAALLFLQQHAARRAPFDRDVLVIGPGGGSNVLAVDACGAAGLHAPALEPHFARDLAQRLRLGAGTSLANPIEVPVGPLAEPGLVPAVLRAVLERRAFSDVLVHANVQSFYSYAASGAEPLARFVGALGEVAAALPSVRLTLALRNGECAPPDVLEPLHEAALAAGIASYHRIEDAALAIRAGKRALAVNG